VRTGTSNWISMSWKSETPTRRGDRDSRNRACGTLIDHLVNLRTDNDFCLFYRRGLCETEMYFI
jgi:hypothetical protein